MQMLSLIVISSYFGDCDGRDNHRYRHHYARYYPYRSCIFFLDGGQGRGGGARGRIKDDRLVGFVRIQRWR